MVDAKVKGLFKALGREMVSEDKIEGGRISGSAGPARVDCTGS